MISSDCGNIIFGKRPREDIIPGRGFPGFEAMNLTGSIIYKGKAVNAYNASGIIAIKLADNSTMSTECHGFAQDNIGIGAIGFVQTGERLSILSGATPATWYFLGEDGNIVPNAPFPADEDSIIQIVGLSVSPTELEIRIFQPHGINLP